MMMMMMMMIRPRVVGTTCRRSQDLTRCCGIVNCAIIVITILAQQRDHSRVGTDVVLL